LEGPGQAMGQPDFVADHATAVFDEWRQGAPGGALGGERGELVVVFEQELDLECGVGRVVLRSAGGKRCAGLGQRERMDGKEHEEILLTPRRHDGPCMQL
jgi:hypothetical protein